jgi:nucleotide-binding universal stress UspA family protein
MTASSLDRILVCVDFSEVTDSVVGYATTVAALAGAEVRLLHVAAPNPDFVGYEAGPDTVRKQVARELRDEHRKLEALSERMREANVRAGCLMVQGATVETILDHARRFHASLVVVGSHGHSRLRHLIAGSVAEGVLRGSSVPVLVVPDRPS